MRQRLTYLLPHGTGLDKGDIKVGADHLTFSNAAQAAQEWRLTLDLEELPDEVRLLLLDVQSLHLRWASPQDEDRISPLVARTPPGFHAFFTPRHGNIDVPLCDFFTRLIDPQDLKCHSVAESFSRPQLTTERVPTSPSLQFVANASPNRQLGELFLGKLCRSGSTLDACEAQIEELVDATYVDVDYDGKSRTVILTAFWSAPDRSPGALVAQRMARPVRKIGADDRLEVGVLSVENTDEAEKIKLGGYLTVLGEDDHPGAALFSFPSRHHPLPSPLNTTFHATFQQPTGLHPKLLLRFSSSTLKTHAPGAHCALQTYLTLPSTLFIDRYQLSDPAVLRSLNLLTMHSLSGETDLEAPDWVVKSWGSASLFQLAVPGRTTTTLPPKDAAEEEWIVTIPLHLRYLNGSTSPAQPVKDYVDLQIPWPTVFWACKSSTDTDFNEALNPFDRVDLGYDGLFSPLTVFYHVPPARIGGAHSLVETLRAPILDVDQARWVDAGTLGVVAVGFAWVCWRLFGGVAASAARGEAEEKKGK